MKRLKERLEKLNRKPYGAYKSLKGSYSFVDFCVQVEHVQGDPFAAPSLVCVHIPFRKSGFSEDWLNCPHSRVALGDFITRMLASSFSSFPKLEGTGNSGKFLIPVPGQQILPRSSVLFEKEHIQIRFKMGLPADGRSITAAVAQEMFFGNLPGAISSCCFCQDSFKNDLAEHITLYLRQLELRRTMEERGLVAFVPENAILPRDSGASDLPLDKQEAVPFVVPEGMEECLTLEDGTSIKGMGIKKGITLIVGGGFHGKSTLLRALELGIYPHIKGDGREFVCTLEDAVKIRAENGRVVSNVNIEPFIKNLPQGKDTKTFSTPNASGSTSQAASIIEAVNTGSTLLLMDEDTCATNFMVRDEKMRQLIADDDEPITPFLNQVENLYSHMGVSTILVMGGVGDYFACATEVIGLKNFIPVNVTKKAHTIADATDKLTAKPVDVAKGVFHDKRKLAASRSLLGKNKIKAKSNGLIALKAGEVEVNIRYLEQLVCKEQVNTLAQLLKELLITDGELDFKALRRFCLPDNTHQFRMLPEKSCDYAGVRFVDIVSVLNRAPGICFQKVVR
ncbi:MAG: ABC-ATPase domain-containing protein [Fibrobacteria bacterium]|nr:ABC-ATPase domain-containing protein [Fibrobacteria bacterium]